MDFKKYYDRSIGAFDSSPEKGEKGEQVACAILEHILRGHTARFQGNADQGLDLAFIGKLPCPQRPLLHFVAQVKTGPSHVAKLNQVYKEKKDVLIASRINAKRLLEWRRLEAPVLFLWVDDKSLNIFWTLVNKDKRSKSLFLSEHSFLSPATLYDLIIKLNRKGVSPSSLVEGNDLRARGKIALKEYARNYYINNMLRRMVFSPVLGYVAFTWAGWRHIVRNRRTHAETSRSLALLPLAGEILKHSADISGFRRLHRTIRGKITTESRLISLEKQSVKIRGRAQANIIVVVKERLVYPTDWRDSFNYHAKMIRDLTFYSIYEKEEGQSRT